MRARRDQQLRPVWRRLTGHIRNPPSTPDNRRAHLRDRSHHPDPDSCGRHQPGQRLNLLSLRLRHRSGPLHPRAAKYRHRSWAGLHSSRTGRPIRQPSPRHHHPLRPDSQQSLRNRHQYRSHLHHSWCQNPSHNPSRDRHPPRGIGRPEQRYPGRHGLPRRHANRLLLPPGHRPLLWNADLNRGSRRPDRRDPRHHIRLRSAARHHLPLRPGMFQSLGHFDQP